MSRCMIADAPSGGSGDSHACCAATTRSAGSSARAPPPLPSPSISESVGASRVTRSPRQRAISPARPPFSALTDSAAPAVSMTVSSGSPSSEASRIPRRASRSASGPSGCAAVWPRRSCPRNTHGTSPKRTSAISRPGSDSPCPVPLRGTTSAAAYFSSRRTPGRSGSRERVTASQVSTSGTGSSAGSSTADRAARSGSMQVSARSRMSGMSSGATTASMMPRA